MLWVVQCPYCGEGMEWMGHAEWYLCEPCGYRMPRAEAESRNDYEPVTGADDDND